MGFLKKNFRKKSPKGYNYPLIEDDLNLSISAFNLSISLTN
jgi:hypothetical protein